MLLSRSNLKWSFEPSEKSKNKRKAGAGTGNHIHDSISLLFFLSLIPEHIFHRLMEISGDTKQHLIRCCLLLSLNSSNRVRTGLHQQSQMILCQSLLSTKLFLIRLELHHTTSPSRYFLVRLLLKCSIKQCTKIPTATAYFPVLACVQSIPDSLPIFYSFSSLPDHHR